MEKLPTFQLPLLLQWNEEAVAADWKLAIDTIIYRSNISKEYVFSCVGLHYWFVLFGGNSQVDFDIRDVCAHLEIEFSEKEHEFKYMLKKIRAIYRKVGNKGILSLSDISVEKVDITADVNDFPF